jgi:hypothetical protein
MGTQEVTKAQSSSSSSEALAVMPSVGMGSAAIDVMVRQRVISHAVETGARRRAERPGWSGVVPPSQPLRKAGRMREPVPAKAGQRKVEGGSSRLCPVLSSL